MLTPRRRTAQAPDIVNLVTASESESESEHVLGPDFWPLLPPEVVDMIASFVNLNDVSSLFSTTNRFRPTYQFSVANERFQNEFVRIVDKQVQKLVSPHTGVPLEQGDLLYTAWLNSNKGSGSLDWKRVVAATRALFRGLQRCCEENLDDHVGEPSRYQRNIRHRVATQMMELHPMYNDDPDNRAGRTGCGQCARVTTSPSRYHKAQICTHHMCQLHYQASKLGCVDCWYLD